MRISECLNLRRSDICLESNQLKVASGKGEKARIVIVNSKIVSAVHEYQKKDTVESEWLFHNSRGERLNQTTINRVFKLCCPKEYDITPHTLRHFYAINAVSSGIFTIPEIANQMGHSSIKTTMRYMNPNLEEIRQKVIAALTEHGECTPENVDRAMSSKIYDLEDLIDIREYVERMEKEQRKKAEQKRRGGR